MVKIRLTRFGRTHLPFYRVVAINSKTKRDGAFIEVLGTYEPFDGVINLKEEEIIKWLNFGAQPSTTVKNMLQKKGIWKKFVDQKNANKKAKK